MNSENIKTVISFIIPALNEEECIRDVIRSVKAYSPGYEYEIIVVDNGSIDRTPEIVKEEGAALYIQTKNTIASARNKGVSMSEGQVIIFLDADVLLTESWQRNINATIMELLNDSSILTGSRYGVPDERNWISRYWFARMINETANYINGGHLIVTRELFDKIEGFSEKLGTAEDYDFCMKAKRGGAWIVNRPELHVVHTGYPTTLRDFVGRERWLGYEDFTSFRKTIVSKVALIAILNLLLLLLFSVLAALKGSILYVFMWVITLYIISGVSTIHKFGYGSVSFFLMTTAIFLLYYSGRSMAFIDRMKNHLHVRDHKNRSL